MKQYNRIASMGICASLMAVLVASTGCGGMDDVQNVTFSARFLNSHSAVIPTGSANFHIAWTTDGVSDATDDYPVLSSARVDFSGGSASKSVPWWGTIKSDDFEFTQCAADVTLPTSGEPILGVPGECTMRYTPERDGHGSNMLVRGTFTLPAATTTDTTGTGDDAPSSTHNGQVFNIFRRSQRIDRAGIWDRRGGNSRPDGTSEERGNSYLGGSAHI